MNNYYERVWKNTSHFIFQTLCTKFCDSTLLRLGPPLRHWLCPLWISAGYVRSSCDNPDYLPFCTPLFCNWGIGKLTIHYAWLFYASGEHPALHFFFKSLHWKSLENVQSFILSFVLSNSLSYQMPSYTSHINKASFSWQYQHLARNVFPIAADRLLKSKWF